MSSPSTNAFTARFSEPPDGVAGKVSNEPCTKLKEIL
jgi:hypothetical protein